MKLYCPVSLQKITEKAFSTEFGKSFDLFLDNRLTNKYESECAYSLSLFRQAIKNYEKNKGISPAKSKSEIPFFRENQNLFVGPEMHLYAANLYETYETCLEGNPDLVFRFDYDKLGEHCIFENLFLLKCKYDETQNLLYFEKEFEKEYEKFFYNEEYTGFASDSRFFSLLCHACLAVRKPESAVQNEWTMASLVMPEGASYQYNDGCLESFFTTSIPFDIIEQISMPDYKARKDEYTAFAGLLKQKGLNPVDVLEGYE
ncbi:hypothetical protein [Massilibacteroides sp.]|uniref:hypothetical protein n=1 Tax=Massilibacteroides sp. TaxID=2034766 RepID=UPI00260EB50B|nr:hypothetical protein [Massilibacteroides sp.]MDD4516327.1 hypothetical protein [Massilibacteroides sp.]